MMKVKLNVLSVIVTLIFFVGVPQSAVAGVISTPGLITQTLDQQNLQQSRHQIQQQLVELGVDPLMAKTRADSLSDQQVVDISDKLSDLPAGASAAGVILTVFIVFVITDVIGATDIFPFIEPVK